MDQQRIDEIRARCEAATPGPWKVVVGQSFSVQSDSKNIAWCFRGENDQFIAHARTDIPDLLAEVERLTRELEAAKRDFHDYVHHGHESCAFCIHDDECEPGESLCYANKIGWEWRGLCAENGGAE